MMMMMMMMMTTTMKMMMITFTFIAPYSLLSYGAFQQQLIF